MTSPFSQPVLFLRCSVDYESKHTFFHKLQHVKDFGVTLFFYLPLFVKMNRSM